MLQTLQSANKINNGLPIYLSTACNDDTNAYYYENNLTTTGGLFNDT